MEVIVIFTRTLEQRGKTEASCREIWSILRGAISGINGV